MVRARLRILPYLTFGWFCDLLRPPNLGEPFALLRPSMVPPRAKRSGRVSMRSSFVSCWLVGPARRWRLGMALPNIRLHVSRRERGDPETQPAATTAGRQEARYRAFGPAPRGTAATSSGLISTPRAGRLPPRRRHRRRAFFRINWRCSVRCADGNLHEGKFVWPVELSLSGFREASIRCGKWGAVRRALSSCLASRD